MGHFPLARQRSAEKRLAGLSGCGKSSLFCHSEQSEESLFDLTP
jgi:hypothetical protein